MDLMEEQKRQSKEEQDTQFTVTFLRRLAFATGLGVFFYGLALIIHEYGEGPMFMGWGAFFVGLAIPLGK